MVVFNNITPTVSSQGDFKSLLRNGNNIVCSVEGQTKYIWMGWWIHLMTACWPNTSR